MNGDITDVLGISRHQCPGNAGNFIAYALGSFSLKRSYLLTDTVFIRRKQWKRAIYFDVN